MLAADRDLHEGGVVALGGHAAVDGAHIGVHGGDDDLIGIAVVEDLGQHAVGGVVDSVVAAALDGQGPVGVSLTVFIDGDLTGVHGVVQAQIPVDVAGLHLGGVGHVGLAGIGAQLHAVQTPHVGGTAEVVGVVIQLQVAEILLGELHEAVLVDVAVVVDAGAPGLVLGLVAGDGDGGAVDVDGGLGVILHQGGLQHVEGVQGGLLTGHGLGAHELVVAVVQADTHGLLDDVDGPVGAGVALDGAVIAQGAQQHLHEGVAAQRVSGTEGAVGVAVDDALLRAVGDVAREGVGHGNILEGGGACAQSAGGGGAEDQVADDLRGRATGQDSIRAEGIVAVAVDDVQRGDDVDGFFVSDVAVIGEVLGAGADGDQRQGHRQSQNQRKELLHWVFTSFKICRSKVRKIWGKVSIKIWKKAPFCIFMKFRTSVAAQNWKYGAAKKRGCVKSPLAETRLFLRALAFHFLGISAEQSNSLQTILIFRFPIPENFQIRN